MPNPDEIKGKVLLKVKCINVREKMGHNWKLPVNTELEMEKCERC